MNTQERNRPSDQGNKREDHPRNIPQDDGTQKNQDEFLDNRDNLRAAQDNNPSDVDDDKEIQRKWEDVRENFMLRYENLRDEDITHGDRPGDFDRMLDRIQEKTGRDKEQLRNEIMQLNTDSRL